MNREEPRARIWIGATLGYLGFVLALNFGGVWAWSGGLGLLLTKAGF